MIRDIRQFILDNFCFGKDPGVADDSSFLEMGIIDSTGVLELVAFLETKYSIAIKDEELVPDNLDSINNVVAYLQTKMPVGVQETHSAEER